MFLTESQIEQLTRRKRPSAQIRELAKAGIRFRVVSGRPVVVERDLAAPETRTVKRL